MSRIGNAPITVPSGVTVTIASNEVTVDGPKGKLTMDYRPEITIKQDGDKIIVSRKNDDKFIRSLHGLYRSKLSNMITGVTSGWSRNLDLVGVGYRAQGGGDNLNLSVGFSHPVKISAPQGVSFNVADNTKISVSGIDKILVGQVAANIRGVKPPEVYKGKGIRYSGEFVRKKAGKAGKAAGVK